MTMQHINIILTLFGAGIGFIISFVTMRVLLDNAIKALDKETKTSKEEDEKIVIRLALVEKDMTRICTTCPARLINCTGRWKINKEAFDKAFKEIRYNNEAILTMETRLLKELNETMYKNFSRAIASLSNGKKDKK